MQGGLSGLSKALFGFFPLPRVKFLSKNNPNFTPVEVCLHFHLTLSPALRSECGMFHSKNLSEIA